MGRLNRLRYSDRQRTFQRLRNDKVSLCSAAETLRADGSLPRPCSPGTLVCSVAVSVSEGKAAPEGSKRATGCCSRDGTVTVTVTVTDRTPELLAPPALPGGAALPGARCPGRGRPESPGDCSCPRPSSRPSVLPWKVSDYRGSHGGSAVSRVACAGIGTPPRHSQAASAKAG